MAKANILLVEDNKIQASVIREFLEKNGYEVMLAEDGMSAFKAAKTDHPDIILLDRVLPDIEGSDICRWLKLDQVTRGIPIIMLTEKDSIPDRIVGLEAGADDYLPKPFDENELNARIYAQLRTKSQQDELKQKNQQLEDMLTRVETLAVSDSLTGLFNRRRFEFVLSNEFKRASRYKSELSCLMIDIDHFKKVNDALGHQAGDALLREIAQIIQRCIRDVDTLARWGGEEFVVLGPNTSTENAKLAAARILNAVSQHAFTDCEGIKVTVSIGIAGLPNPAIDTQEKLINAADLAMYEAKKNGRNRLETASLT
ncbi:MAG: diguanylate cyclase [Nitrospirae bacterium]|nr:diguanylate cyclase [Nitrospirota bacterium]